MSDKLVLIFVALYMPIGCYFMVKHMGWAMTGYVVVASCVLGFAIGFVWVLLL